MMSTRPESIWVAWVGERRHGGICPYTYNALPRHVHAIQWPRSLLPRSLLPVVHLQIRVHAALAPVTRTRDTHPCDTRP